MAQLAQLWLSELKLKFNGINYDDSYDFLVLIHSN